MILPPDVTTVKNSKNRSAVEAREISVATSGVIAGALIELDISMDSATIT